MSISIALLGAGIFAREGTITHRIIHGSLINWDAEYVPALSQNDKVSLKAVYSRSKSSADKLASQIGGPVDVYYDSPTEQGKQLEDLLRRTDIKAVIACLPITAQPQVIKKSLSRRKARLERESLLLQPPT